MEDYIWLFVVIGLFTAGGVISWIIETISNSKKYIKLKSELDSLGKDKEEHLLRVKTEEERLDKKTRQLTEAFESAKNDLEKIAGQKSMGFPWLAEAYAEYFSLRDLRRAEYLEKKKHPALTAAETVKEIRNEKRELVKENKVVTYKLTYYQKLFPWLIDLIAEDETEEIPVQMEDGVTRNENKEDRVKEFLTPEEYKQLPSVERNQRALDRYLANRNKSKWALGRDYEMYVGYLYQQKGYSIEYKGIIDGYADLGRDIIAIKDNEVCIIQCKYYTT